MGDAFIGDFTVIQYLYVYSLNMLKIKMLHLLFALGLFNIIKLPRLNSLLSHMPDTLDLAFKLKRKKFTIEVGYIM